MFRAKAKINSHRLLAKEDGISIVFGMCYHHEALSPSRVILKCAIFRNINVKMKNIGGEEKTNESPLVRLFLLLYNKYYVLH